MKKGETNPDIDRSPAGGKVRKHPTLPVRPSTFEDPLHKTAGTVWARRICGRDESDVEVMEQQAKKFSESLLEA